VSLVSFNYHLTLQSFEEVKTAAKVVDLLISYCGIPKEDIIESIGRTGLIATIRVTE